MSIRCLTRSIQGLAMMIIIALFSCCNDDDINTAQDAQPAFSTDTLHMGTVLAAVSSPTYQVMIYNPGSKAIALTSVSLRNAATSGFRMNLDGMNGDTFSNPDLLHIAAHDSAYIFVEATLPKAEARNGRTMHFDYIDICCNSKTSTIVLEAECQDVTRLSNALIDEDTTWPHGSEILVTDSLVIAPNVTLTLEDSVTIYMHDKADLIIYGRLMALGKPTAPVTIRGDRTDKMFDNLPYDNLPAQWGTCYIRQESHGNEWESLYMRGMSNGIRIDSGHVDQTRLTMNACQIRNSGGSLIYAHAGNAKISNCELSNAQGALLELYGGNYDIVHCTLANYNFAAAIEKTAVVLSNFEPEGATEAPLYSCNFTNTLIWGRKYDTDVTIDYVAPEAPNDSIFAYHFDHCLIKANGTDDNDFIATIWNEDPMYTLIDEPNYSYDFHPLQGSPAIATGNAGTTSAYPLDLEGVARTGNKAPNIGCYESITADKGKE